jgi:hypothetical protein
MTKEQPNLNQFRIAGNRVQYIGENRKETNFIFNKVIPIKEPFTFKIRIEKSTEMGICIGVIHSTKTDNKVSYMGTDGGVGFLNPESEMIGNGFSCGQVVEVLIDRKNRYMKWSVGGNEKARSTNRLLAEDNVQLMPFVEIKNKGDIIEWV